VRAQHDRNLISHQKLWAHMAGLPCEERRTVKVPRRPGQPSRTAEVKCGGIGWRSRLRRWAAKELASGGGLGGLSSRTESGRECREHWNRTASVVRHHTRLAPRHKGHVLTTPIIRVRCRVLWRFSPWALGRLASLVMAPSGWRDDRCARDRSCNPSRADWESGRRAHPER
jgi:hypothetical protein